MRGSTLSRWGPSHPLHLSLSPFPVHIMLPPSKDEAAALKDPTNTIRTMNPEMRNALDALYKEYQEPVSGVTQGGKTTQHIHARTHTHAHTHTTHARTHTHTHTHTHTDIHTHTHHTCTHTHTRAHTWRTMLMN